MSPVRFLLKLESALGADNKNVDNTQYFKDDNDRTLRVANHRMNASMFLLYDHTTGNTSIVVKMSDKKFVRNRKVDAVEFVYFPDKLTKEVQLSIIDGIKEWVANGEYDKPCDQMNSSIKRSDGKIRMMRENMRITDKIRFFRTSDGEAYGFVMDGKIYIDPKIARADTPIHEYSHLWSDALRKKNPTEWKNVVELMKGTSIWEDVRQRYPELETDDEMADEVLAQYSGSRGAERLRKLQESSLSWRDKRLAAVKAINQLKEALSRFWRDVADMFNIHFTTAEEVADKVLADMLNGEDMTSEADKSKKAEVEAEKAEIKAKAETSGTFLKAPNGKDTNLTPDEYTTVRTKSFKGFFGDWENPNAEGDCSKVVDENGEPLAVYHGSRSRKIEPFSIFEPDENYGVFFSSDKGTAGWFTDNWTVTHVNKHNIPKNIYEGKNLDNVSVEEMVDYLSSINNGNYRIEYYNETGMYRIEDNMGSSPAGKTVDELKQNLVRKIDSEINRINSGDGRPLYKVYLNIRNPLVVDAKGAEFDEIPFEGSKCSSAYVARIAKERGYDGVIIKNNKETTGRARRDSNTYIVFEPNQIKSATDNIGTFDKANPDIRYSHRERTRAGATDDKSYKELTPIDEVATPAFKNNRGTRIARGGKVGGVAYEVGKVMAGTVYFHKNYADQVLPKGLLEKAEQYLPEGFTYNTLAWDPKQPNVLRFDECEGFDTDLNPVVGRQFKVNVETGEPLYKTPDGTRYEAQIFHDKWQWVGNDYKGFDVQESYNWSRLYNSRIESTPSGRLEKWQEQLRKAGLTGQEELTTTQLYRNTAEQAAKSVGEEVTVVEKVEDIVDDDPKVQLKKRGAKGWYDPETGKVVVNLSAHRDAADVAETVFHETIGHKGIEKRCATLVGDAPLLCWYIPN